MQLNIDFEALHKGNLLKELVYLQLERDKLKAKLRAYKGWRTKRNKNKFASE